MAVTLKCSYNVKPSEPTWQGVISLSIFDQIGSIAHEPIIYLYRRPQNNKLSPPDAIVEALKKSLSEALTHFYPLAGRVRWSKEGGGRLELHCNAMGVEFVEAEADSELDNFFGHDFSPSQKQRHLFPDVNQKYKALPFEEIPPLLVQLTRFACGGISLGLALSQAVADGVAWTHFSMEWARLARGEPLKTAPFLDREVLGAGQPPRASMPWDPAVDFFPKLMQSKESENSDYQKDEIKMDKTTVAKLRLRKDQVERVKDMANEGGEEVKIVRAYSRFEALTAHIWRCVTKARSHEFPEQPTVLAIPIDSRNRVRPPLPWNYFGNAVCDVLPRSSAGELISKPLSFAAGKIRATIEEANSEFIWTTIDLVKNIRDLTCVQNLQSRLDGTPSLKDPNLSVISWLTLPLYGFDFGWGKEMYMSPGEIEGEWAYLLQCPSGDGSLILVLCLQIVHMESFKKHFYDDIV